MKYLTLKLSALAFFICISFIVNARVINVNPGDNLNNKVKSASPGDIVNIAPGTYGNLDFTGLKGTVNNPIIIRRKPGTTGAVNIDGVQIQNGNPWQGVKALKAWNSKYLVFENLTFRKGNEGIHLFNCDHLIFINCDVTLSGNAAVKFSHGTNFIDWLGGRIFNNAKLQGGRFGECFYIGQAFQQYDGVNNIWIEGVEIFDTNGSEAIDVKSEAFRVTVKSCNIHDVQIFNRPGDHSNRGAIQVLASRNSATERRDYDAEVWIEDVTLNGVTNLPGNWEDGADAIFFMANPGITVKNTRISNIEDAAFRAFSSACNYLAEIDNFSKNNATNVGSVQNFGGGTNVVFKNNVGNNPMSRQAWYDGGDIIPSDDLECATANPSAGLTPDLISVSSFDSPHGPCNLMDGDLNTRWSANNAGGGSSGDVPVAIKNVSASSFESKANGGFDDFFPEFGIDGNTGTSWRAEGNGEWIMVELHEITNISSLGVWFFNNDGRKYEFSIQVRANNSDNWETIVNHKQSVQQAAYEYLSINRNVKYIRLLGYGNTNPNFPHWINVCDIVPNTSGGNSGGENATFDLGSVETIEEVQIAFANGNQRQSFFDIQLSSDGSNYTNVITNGASSGSSLNLESFTFPSQNARYIRYVGGGNSENTWNKVTEFVIPSSSCGNPVPFTNAGFTNQTGNFTAEWDMVPGGNNMDGSVGLSNGNASHWNDLAVIVRFNADGKMDVRNGDIYSSSNNIDYIKDNVYHVRAEVNINTRKFDVFVTPDGGSEIQLANNFDFRSHQANVTQLNTRSINSTVCSISIANFNIGTGPVQQYSLTVNNGSGDGTYDVGQNVNISANPPPSGQVFNVWTGNTANIADVNSANTTVTIPSTNISVTANYKPENNNGGALSINGEKKQWHNIEFDLEGPNASEGGNPNPFRDFRYQITFTQGSKSLTVPGYFAADGNAGETSANSGNIWRAHFRPPTTGTWNYAISFREGFEVAINNSATAGNPVSSVDGISGTVEIGATDKTGDDLRGKGRLEYIGEHHLRFAGNGEWFLKAGADAPENFLAFADFDNTPNNGGFEKNWNPHIQDWENGDPVWKGNKGKGIIGAVNYLAKKGMNVFSFLTMNINGDDKNVYPYVNNSDFTKFDCSKLDQWAVVFDHATTKGMYLHFKTQETENEMLLDNGNVGDKRKLYYRELIARYGHYLALNWNLGEENGDYGSSNQSHQQRKDMAAYFSNNDPYKNHIVIHTAPNRYDAIYTPLLGNASKLTGISLQTGWNKVFESSLDWINKSKNAGKKWVVANDEQGPVNIGVPEDGFNGTPNKHDIRKNTLWGNIMAGGAGVEYYFGYERPHSDLTLQDFRSRRQSWEYAKVALDFFNAYVPFWEMSSKNSILSNGNWCLQKQGQVYVVYLKNGGSEQIDLPTGNYTVKWYNAQSGGALQNGNVTNINGGNNKSIGNAPGGGDWVALIREANFSHPGNGNTNPQPDCHVFKETDGYFVIEMESVAALDDDWSIQTGNGSLGEGFIQFDGADKFGSEDGSRRMTYKVQINTTGTYRFLWRTRRGVNAPTHDAQNDSWVRVNASDFYGMTNGNKVGSSGEFMKIWVQSDNFTFNSVGEHHGQNHLQVFADFDLPGEYTIDVSGRSFGHVIDRMVMFKSDKQAIATDINTPESERACDGGGNENYPQIVTVSAEQSPNVASNLYDGNTGDDARWSAQNFPQSVVIDYGENLPIIGTRVYTFQGRQYLFKIEVSQQPNSGYTTVVDRTNNPSGTQPVADNFNQVNGRYVKFTVTGLTGGSTSTWVSINELELVLGSSPDNYSLSVNNGSGDGTYAEGEVVNISCNCAAGFSFDSWTGDVANVANVNACNTIVTMPASNVAISANCVEDIVQYTLSVTNGTGDGQYEAGEVVNIVAGPADAGMQFKEWTGDVANVTDVLSSSTSLTMPAANATVVATYENVGNLGGLPWNEDFTLANGTTEDNGPTSWSSSRNGSFAVQNNKFEVNSGGGEGVWMSQEIDISGNMVDISIDIDGAGGLDNGGQYPDHLRIYTKINGGAEVLRHETNGMVSSQTVAINDLTGNTLEIVIRVVTTGTDEFYYFDNISVQGSVIGGCNISATGSLPWSETFNQVNGTACDEGSTKWSASRSNGIFSVQGNAFTVNDSGGEGIWMSQKIDISGGSADISIGIDGAGSLDNGGQFGDYLRIYTKIDGGAEVLRHDIQGSPSGQTLNINGLSGNELEIVIRIVTTANDEYYYVNNISVQGGGASSRLAASLPGNNEAGLSMTLYPNPAKDLVNLGLPASIEGSVKVEAYNLNGKRVLSQVLQAGGLHQLSIKNLSKGLYLFNISADGLNTQQKLLIE